MRGELRPGPGTSGDRAEEERALDVETDCKSLRCSNVEISADEITEFNGKRAVSRVQRKHIRHIKLSYDTNVKTPFLHFFMGFTLTTLGIIGLTTFIIAAAGEGRFLQRESGRLVLPLVPMVLWVMIGLGFWLLMRVFRARYHFVVDTEEGERKIFFEKAADVREIQQLVRRARLSFGYEIECSILEKMQALS